MWEGDAMMQDGYGRPRDGIGNGDCGSRGAANETWRRLAGRARKGERVLTMAEGIERAFTIIIAVCATVIELPRYNHATYK